MNAKIAIKKKILVVITAETGMPAEIGRTIGSAKHTGATASATGGVQCCYTTTTRFEEDETGSH